MSETPLFYLVSGYSIGITVLVLILGLALVLNLGGKNNVVVAPPENVDGRAGRNGIGLFLMIFFGVLAFIIYISTSV